MSEERSGGQLLGEVLLHLMDIQKSLEQLEAELALVRRAVEQLAGGDAHGYGRSGSER